MPRPTKVNSIAEVLPELEMVHFILAQQVELVQGSGQMGWPDIIATMIGGASGDRIRPFLKQMVRLGILDWDVEKGYSVNGFGVEVLKEMNPSFITAESESKRRIDEAVLRLEVLADAPRNPVREGRHRGSR